MPPSHRRSGRKALARGRPDVPSGESRLLDRVPRTGLRLSESSRTDAPRKSFFLIRWIPPELYLMKRWLVLGFGCWLTATGTVVLQSLPADTPTPGGVEYPAPLVTEGPRLRP